LCVDEAHLIGQKGRGDVVEVALMRFTEINPDARVVLLSATLSNVDDISKWLKSLNGKETIKIKSNWRPARIETRLHSFDEPAWDSQIALAAQLAKESELGEKVVVFVHSKKMGKEISKLVRASGRDCAFHNASVSRNKRKKIEVAFNDPSSGLDILVSTSTLSAGVNIG
jgi:helicase